MLSGFKTFIARGNVVDLAVGVVIGAAFGLVVSGLVESFINPLIAWLVGKPNFDSLVGGVLKCMLVNDGQTKSNGNTIYLSCVRSNYRLLSPLPWTEYKAKRQIRQ